MLDLTGNTHGHFPLGISGFKNCIVRSFVICTFLPNSFGLPLGFSCIIIFDSYMLTSTRLDQN